MKRIGIMIAAAAALIVAAGPMSATAQGRAESQSQGQGQGQNQRRPQAGARPQLAPITDQQRQRGMQEAPALVQAAGLGCAVSEAYFINTTTEATTRVRTNFYEVACRDSMGYVVQAAEPAAGQRTAAPPKTFNCLAIADSAAADAAAGRTGALRCRLSGNLDPKQGLVGLLRAAGRSCNLVNARSMGTTPAGEDYFEVACGGGRGYVLQTALGSNKTPTASDCLQFLGQQIECQLTTKQQIVASLGEMAAQGGRPCTGTDARYVGAASQSIYYEVACGTDSGFMVQMKPDGSFERAIECTRAQMIGGGCTLANTQAAETAEIAAYTKLAKAGGYPCEVAKYRFLGVSQQDKAEVVELACSNRPDGAIAMFPTEASGKALIFDCVQSGSIGVTCSLTKPDAAFAKYTQALVSNGKTSCQVSNAKYLVSTKPGANTPAADLIETACSDGLPGYVVEVNHATGAVGRLFTCGEMRSSGSGCALPTNRTGAAAAAR